MARYRASLNQDLIVPSVARAVECGTPERVAGTAALEQAGNLFGLQRLSESERIAGNEGRSTSLPTPAESRALGMMSRAAGVIEQVAQKLGQAATIAGAYNEAVKSFDAAPDTLGGLNKAAAAINTFVGGVVAGAIDDAIVASTGGAAIGIVNDSWEQHGAGPSQVLVGEAVRWLSRQ